MRHALLLLAALALAGCSAPAAQIAPAPPDQRCWMVSATADWQEPGLYAALPAAARAAGFEVRTEWGPNMPMTSAALDALYQKHEAMAVTWTPGGPAELRLAPHLPGELAITVAGAEDASARDALFGRFLEHLGLADHPERPAWERALVASHGREPLPQAIVVARPDLGGLYDALLAQGEPNVTAAGPGAVLLEWPGWRMHLQVGFAQVIAGVDDTLIDIIVAEDDRVRAGTTLRPGEAPYPTLQARTNATFARLGLPPPTFEGATGGSDAC